MITSKPNKSSTMTKRFNKWKAEWVEQMHLEWETPVLSTKISKPRDSVSTVPREWPLPRKEEKKQSCVRSLLQKSLMISTKPIEMSRECKIVALTILLGMQPKYRLSRMLKGFPGCQRNIWISRKHIYDQSGFQGLWIDFLQSSPLGLPSVR